MKINDGSCLPIDDLAVIEMKDALTPVVDTLDPAELLAWEEGGEFWIRRICAGSQTQHKRRTGLECVPEHAGTMMIAFVPLVVAIVQTASELIKVKKSNVEANSRAKAEDLLRQSLKSMIEDDKSERLISDHLDRLTCLVERLAERVSVANGG